MPFSSHHTEGTYCQHDLLQLLWTSSTWTRWCVSGSPWTSGSFPCPYCPLWRVHYEQPTQGGKQAPPPPEWGATSIIWNSSVGKICLFSPRYLFIQSFIYVGMDSWIFILFLGLWCNSSSMFCSSNCSIFGHWKLSLCSCIHLTCPTMVGVLNLLLFSFFAVVTRKFEITLWHAFYFCWTASSRLLCRQGLGVWKSWPWDQKEGLNPVGINLAFS